MCAAGEGASPLPLPSGRPLPLAGRVDRIDEHPDGTWRVIDYKTGRAFALAPKRGPFDGGRKLQLPLYAAMVAHAHGVTVADAQYRFPTIRGEGEVLDVDAATLASAPALLVSLLDDVAAGRFLPTDDAADCRFCDYLAVCRVHRGDYNTVTSPRAAWTATRPDDEPALVNLRRRRTPQEDDA